MRAIHKVPFFVLTVALFLGFMPMLFGQVYYDIADLGLGKITIIDGNCTFESIPIIEESTGQNIVVTSADLAMCENGLIYTTGTTVSFEDDFLLEVDPETGFSRIIGPAPEGTVGFVGAGCDGNGNVYFVGWEFPFMLINPVLYVANINTGVFTFLGALPFRPQGDIVLFNGTWYMTAVEGLVEVDIDDPMNSTLLFPGPSYVGLSVYPARCNTLIGGSGQFSLIDLATGAEMPLCAINASFNGGLTSIQEFGPISSECRVAIDLDENDSSGALQADFNAPNVNCLNADNIPLTDADLVISSSGSIHQMTISISGGLLDPGFEYLTLEPPTNIQVTGSGTDFLSLVNLGGATIADFSLALSAVVYKNEANPLTPGLRTVVISFETVDFELSNIATSFLTIEDLGQVVVDLGPDRPLCQSDTITLSGGSEGEGYSWSTNDTTQSITISTPGTYGVTVNDGEQCPGSDEIRINLADNDEVNLNFISCDPNEVGIYRENLQNQFGCDSIVVTNVRLGSSSDCAELNSAIFVPNVFSPNGDGFNDRFTLFGEPNQFTIEELRIFTRWGEPVFIAFELLPNDLSVGWDGTHRGKSLNSGVFVFWAQVRYADGTTDIEKGEITLTR
ncbi:MAG: gliding motility-associated C-terminal domain-containing protein [Bacteroidota bacterium]